MSLRTLTLAVLTFVPNILAAPSHGPAKGYLVISGGGPGNGMKEFLQLAGGPSARIVVIPTASIVGPVSQQELDRACAMPDFAKLHCGVIHTTDPKVADSDAFVKPLLDATGVWLEGGRHWRLADAYLNTRTLKELFNLLDRGGVIGGGSAGATIQGSYMVRGSSNPDDNTIMMAPGHEVGFGLFTNVTIDQHVDARNRENDLAPVMKAHPELLGLGLDQNCSITVHGDGILVNGPQRVAVWDGKEHDGKGFYYLHAGDKLNTVTRVATIASTPPPGSHREISLPKETLTSYVGVYQMRPGIYMTISLDGNQMLSQLANQPNVPIFAESPTMFFTKVVEAQLEFVKDAEGKPTTLILHQNGADRPMKRLDNVEAKRVADEAAAKAALAAKHYKDQKPDPRSEAAIRRNIEELRAGQPKYDLMSEQLAEATRRQLPGLEKLLAELGVLESVTFKSVAPNGADIYDVKFEHGSTEWRITMLPDGKIEGVGFRRE